MKIPHYQYLKNTYLESFVKYNFPCDVLKGENIISNIYFSNKDKFGLLADKYIINEYGNLIKIEEIKKIVFNNKITPKEFYKLKREIIDNKIKNLIVMGGGRAMDMGKLIKRDVDINLILIPTSPSTCAAFTDVSVMYDENGCFFDIIETSLPDKIFIDYKIFYKSPKIFFSAGIVDTLAKYFEIKRAKHFFKSLESDLIFELSKYLYKRLKKIIKKWENLTLKLIKEIVDINIIYSGLISLIGKNTYTSFLAHIIGNSFTVIKNTHDFLHGEHIGVALVLQEKYFKNIKASEEIQDILLNLDLPSKLSDLNISINDINKILNFLNTIIKKEKFPVFINLKMLYNIFKEDIKGVNNER